MYVMYYVLYRLQMRRQLANGRSYLHMRMRVTVGTAPLDTFSIEVTN